MCRLFLLITKIINYVYDILINFVKGIIYMNSCRLTTAITALANAMACQFTIEEVTILAAIFVQLGDTLATIVSNKSLCK